MINRLLSALLLMTVLFSSCEVGLREGPPTPLVEIVPVAPSPAHVWVGGYYVNRNNSYQWNRGVYVVPPRGKTRWTEGRYTRTTTGYFRYQTGTWR